MRDYNAILELAKEKAVTPHFYLHAIGSASSNIRLNQCPQFG